MQKRPCVRAWVTSACSGLLCAFALVAAMHARMLLHPRQELVAQAAGVPTQTRNRATPSPTPSSGPVISAPSIAKPRAEYQFPVGQTYVYSAQWRVFNAGIATLRMEKVGRENRVLGTADASGAVAVLYHVQDSFEAFLDPSTFCSRNISRHTEEGFRRIENSVTFDYQNGKAVLDQKNLKKNETRHESHDIPSCVTDILSGIYYVASLPLEPGRSFSFPLNDGGNTVNVHVRVEAREQIKTPAGTFNTVRVQPEAASGVLKDKGKIWIWYSEDALRAPVQMRARMYWGTVTLTLMRIDRR
jgi:Protein of unknown function (DUF3108)